MGGNAVSDRGTRDAPTLQWQRSGSEMFAESFDDQDSFGTVSPGNLFLFELDVADTSLDSQAQGVWGFAVGCVDILSVLIFFEAMDIDGAEAAVDGGDDSDVFRQLDDGFTDSALDDGLEVFAALAGEIDVGLARADIEFQTREVDLGEIQIAASGAHVELEFEGNFIAYFQVPDIVGVHHNLAGALLADAQCADPIGDGIIDGRSVPSVALIKVGFEQALGAAIDAQLSRRHLDIHSHGPRVVQLNDLGFVATMSGVVHGRDPTVALERTVAPKQGRQDKQEDNGADGGTDRESGRGAGCTLALGVVPEHACSDQDQKERPVFSEDRPGIEIGQPTPHEHKDAERDDKKRKDERSATNATLLGHSTPRY